MDCDRSRGACGQRRRSGDAAAGDPERDGTHSLAKIVLVADRGLLSLDNLEAVEALRRGRPVDRVHPGVPARYGEFADLVAKTRLRDGLGEARWTNGES